jgi:hypothetical protein
LALFDTIKVDMSTDRKGERKNVDGLHVELKSGIDPNKKNLNAIVVFPLFGQFSVQLPVCNFEK